MKKILIIILLATACGVPASAQQIDTLYIRNGDRVPNYYYWDTNWADHCWNISLDRVFGWEYTGCKATIARYFHTDTALKVIGLAGIFSIDKSHTDWWWQYDTCMANRAPDYMILYEATDSSFVALDSLCIDTATVRHRYFIDDPYGNKCYDMSEMYFSKPYTVHDSFYIACTHNNNYEYQDDTGQWYINANYPLTYLKIDNYYPDFESNWGHSKPGYIKIICYTLAANNDYSTLDWYWSSYSPYLCIFPIFDTTGMGNPNRPPRIDSCYAVTGLRVVGINHGYTTLSWNERHGQHAFEIAYGPSGTAPENCRITHQDNANFTTLPQLDTAQWYVAYIRADCDTVGYSEWSDSVRFYIPGDTASVFIDGLSPQERHTTLFPNPAQTHCTVVSSFHISHVELFTLQGQRLLQQPVQGLSTEIDIAALPRGNYVVAIHTAAGRVVKILTKR